MQFISTILFALGAVGAVAGPPGSPAEYILKTQLKSGQTGKAQFDNLYLSAYHSGAGFNDAVLLSNKSLALIGYLNKTTVAPTSTHNWYDQKFNISGPYPYDLVILEGVNTYAGWQPVEIDISRQNDPKSIGFWINQTGLQMSTSPTYPKSSSFTGWLVCQWWRGVPQLFWSVDIPSVPIPSSCAHVNLVPLYLP